MVWESQGLKAGQSQSSTFSYSAVLPHHRISVHRIKSKVFSLAFKAARDQDPPAFSASFLCLNISNYSEFLMLPFGWHVNSMCGLLCLLANFSSCFKTQFSCPLLGEVFLMPLLFTLPDTVGLFQWSINDISLQVSGAWWLCSPGGGGGPRGFFQEGSSETGSCPINSRVEDMTGERGIPGLPHPLRPFFLISCWEVATVFVTR